MNKAFQGLIAVALAISTAATTFLAAPEVAQASGHHACIWHTVRRGDTLSRLAAWYGSSVVSIMQANYLRNTWIYPGQRLCVPQRAPAIPPRPWYPIQQPPVNPWSADYWNNSDLSGAPAASGSTPIINFNWGYGTPDPARVQADNFSGRFTRTSFFTGGRWRFNVTHDDGVRLWLNDELIIDQWSFTGQKTTTVERDLSDGNVTLKLEFVERGGLARLALGFQRVTSLPPPAPPTSAATWTARYYNNADLSGTPAFTTTVPALNLNWGYGSPNASLVVADNWSARFTSRVTFPAGVTRFSVQADDGVRISIGGTKIIDTIATPNYGVVTADINLGSGDHDVTVDFLEKGGVANLNFWWSRP